MSDKREMRSWVHKLQRIKTWQLIVLFILFAFIAATFLRLNNIGMIERRTAVIAADKEGDTMALQARVAELQRYSSSRMNADSGLFYLQEQYKRDVKKASDAAASDDNPNGNVAKKSVETCRPRFSQWSPAWVQCVTSEMAKYPGAPQLINALNLPPSALYRFQYDSPLWSPDFAGFSILICFIILVVILVRLLALFVLRLMLRRHYKSV